MKKFVFILVVLQFSLSACTTIRPKRATQQGLFQGQEQNQFAETPRSPSPGKSTKGFVWPMRSGMISSYYGKRRRDFHDGIDISAPRGTPIHAAKEGTVIYSSRKIRGYGNMIVLKHKDGTYTVYAHNQKNLVKKGEEIKQGEQIALLGATGKATGPHLHFEVRLGQRSVDPVQYLPEGRIATQSAKN